MSTIRRSLSAVLCAAGLLTAGCAGVQETIPAHTPPPARPAASPAPAVTEAHYRVYTSAGRPAAWADVVAAMREAQVVFVGETHDDPVAHHLEARLLEDAYRQYGADRPVALSLEMFSRDVQYIVDEYLDSLITERHFLASSNPWQNYATDYRPMVELARAHGLPVLAANAPRRYVNRVSRLGPGALAVLGARAREALPPLPYPEPSDAYRAKWDRLMRQAMGTHGADTTAEAGAHPPMPAVSNMLYAQALWDAAMAHTLAGYLTAHPEALVLHMVGGFHVAGGTGTPEVLQHYRPGTPTLNIALQPAADVTAFPPAAAGAGDFVILTDATLPRSYDAGMP